MKILTFLRLIKNSKGQGLVEYVMLIMVLSIIMTSLFSKLQNYMLDNPNSQLNAALKFTDFESQGGCAPWKCFGVRQ